MTRTRYRERREMAGLLGSLVIFLAGVPGHSETWVGSTKIVVKHIIQFILVFLGLATPVVHTVQAPLAKVHHPKIVHVVKKAVVASKPLPDSMMFGTDPHLHHFNYIFEGK